MKKLRKTNIFYCDFETLTYHSKTFQQRLKNKERGLTDIWLWCILKNEQEYEIGNSIEEFMENIFNKAKTLNGSLILYFHNLSFDGNFIFKWLMKNYPEWFKQDICDDYDRYTPYFKIFTDSNKIYTIEINYVYYKKTKNGNSKKTNTNIVFKCSLLILSSSVEKLGESLGLAKYDGVEELINDGLIKSYDDFYTLGDYDLKETNVKIYNVFCKYIINDCTIIYYALNNFEKTLLSEENEDIYFYKKSKNGIKKEDINISLKNHMTIASIAFKLMINNVYLNALNDNFKDKKLTKHLYIYNEDQYNLAKLSYRGGFTQFHIGKQLTEVNKRGLVIDITSSYPYQMTKLIPYDNTRYYKDNLNWDKYHYLKYYDVVIDYKIKKEYKNTIHIIPKAKQINKYMTNEQMEELMLLSDILTNGNPKYRYPESGSGRYIVYEEEYHLWKKLYDIKEHHKEEFYLKSDYYLKPFIDKYYTLKENADKNGQEALKQCYKILLNSCYGATAKRKQYNEIYASKEVIEKRTKIDFGKFDKKENLKTYNVEVQKEKKWKLGNEYINLYELKENRNLTKFPNAMIASQITSYGRIQLIKTILNIGLENFLYCDTDSVFFTWNWKDEEEMVRLKKIVDIDPFKLGGWKIEENKTFDCAIIRGAKDYTLWKDGKNVSIAMSGIKKSKQKEIAREYDKFFFLNDVLEIENATLQKMECENGVFLEWKTKEKLRGNY